MIEIGHTPAGATVALPLPFANRHGLVTGATGTGKTVTLQLLAEGFSSAGVPVFAADIKGDLSGIAAVGNADSKAARRAVEMGIAWTPRRCPICFFDIFEKQGLPIRTSVHNIGVELLASMLHLNPTQHGALAIAFTKARDDGDFLLSLDDLRWELNTMLEMREEVCQRYGNVTASSIAAIQRSILALESQGGDRMFGEPPFAIVDFLRVEDGRGVVNLLHADNLMEAPRLYATFLLWLLTELFRALPEAGDLDRPKLVFFFDEAHLLFADAPKPLLQQIERLVRLVRSKGVGVYFVTQSPTDIPSNVLEQLGTRIMHAMRAHTDQSLRKIRAAADTIRPNPTIKTREVLPTLGVGEALVSVIGSDNVPSPVERVRIFPPAAQVGPISALERGLHVQQSPLAPRYGTRMSDDEMQRAFVDRMRAAHGMPAIEWGEPWREGDFVRYLPEIELAPVQVSKPRYRPNMWALLGAVGLFVLGAWQSGLLV